MNSPVSTHIPWRYGAGGLEDLRAWLASPAQLHVVVDFRSPQTPSGQWHRIMTVTTSWVQRQLSEAGRGAIWPALLIVPDGSRQEIEASITSQVELGWPLLIMSATLLPLGYKDPED